MTLSIFCPSSHLILDAPRCAQCGWTRLQPADLGKPAWGPLDLGAGLGGPGRSVFAMPAAAQAAAVFPLRNGELAGIDIESGRLRWRAPLDVGHMARCLVPDGRHLLLSISDERPLEQAGPGRLAALEPLSGELHTLWQPDASLLSPPVLAGGKILLRTSQSELVALAHQDRPQILWRRALQAWWALPPAVFGDLILISDGRAMQGEGILHAYALQDGQPAWEVATEGLLAQNPVESGGLLVLRDGRRNLAALDLRSGELRWQRSYARVYSNLLAAGRLVYIVVRGAVPAGQPGHYLLQAIDPQTEQITWEMPVPSRVRILQAVDTQTLVMGDDDGRLSACSAVDGKQLWEYALGSNEDPIHTELLVVNGLLLAGTYSGQVAALQIAPPVETPGDAHSLLAEGDHLSAAAAFALQGDLLAAGQVYANNLNEPEKALALYERGQFFEQAGSLALEQEMFRKAGEYFQKAGNLPRQAESLAQMGDSLSAARLFEQLEAWERAAQQYEEAGELRPALEMYRKAGNTADMLRVRKNVPPELSDIEKLENQGMLEEAGVVAVHFKQWRKAVDLLRRCGDQEGELAAVLQLAQAEKGEDWVWERQAELARSQGQFNLEALAWDHLKKYLLAAEAYLRAAQQAEQRTPGKENVIADLYEQALKLFENEGLEDQRQQCWQKVIHYRRLPWIVIEGRTQNAFRETEFNMLELVVHNIGRGVAHDVRVVPDSSRFEIDQSATMARIKHLGSEQSRELKIYIRPQQGQIGEAVPLVLEWHWVDNLGNKYSDCVSAPVSVKAKSASPTGGTPVQIINQYTGSTIYQAPEGNIDVISGSKIGGDQVTGDKISGGQKGDSVSVTHTSGSTGRPGQAQTVSQERLCPTCSLPVGADDQFCQGCGHEIDGDR